MRDISYAAIAAASIFVSPVAALAQEASPGAGEDNGIADIVVTARRREESLQKVPVAVTALSGDALDQKGIRDPNALQQAVPGLTITSNGTADRSRLNFSIRGQQSIFRSPNDAVVTYFAEVPTNTVGHAVLYDLQNVQVLKGPQGTLFGRNTTGGAVLLEPARPKFEFSGAASLRVGNYGKLESDGFINFPVSNTLAIRLAYSAGHTNGFVHDLTSNKDLESESYQSVRFGALWEPSDAISNYFVASWYRERSTGPGNRIVAVRPTIVAPDGTTITNSTLTRYPGILNALARQDARSPFIVESSMENPRNDNDAHSITNIFTWRISDSLTFKNVLGYRYIARNGNSDGDGTAFQVIDNSPLDDIEHQQLFTAEAQLQFKSQLVDGIVGAFFLKDKPTNLDPFTGGSTRQFGTLGYRPNYFTVTSKALFGQVTLKPIDGLNLSGGLRYTWDTVRNDAGQFVVTNGQQVCQSPFTGFAATNCIRALTTKNDKLTWLLSADYTLAPGFLAYVAARRGYMTGGVNGYAPVGAPPVFGPEVVDDVEVGLKSDFELGGVPLRVNLAAFRSKLKGAQRTATVPLNAAGTSVSSVTLNAADATLKGLEAELTAKPFQGLTLSAYYSYTKGKYGEFYTFEYGRDIAGIIPFRYTPKHKWGFSVEAQQSLGDDVGTLVLNTDYSYTSKTPLGTKPDPLLVFNPQTNKYVVGEPFATLPSVGLLNARLTLREVGGSNFDVGLFAQNLTNRVYDRFLLGSTYSAVGFTAATVGAPRMWGVEVKVRIGQ